MQDFIKTNLSDLCPSISYSTFGQVVASFRLRNLQEIYMHPSDDEKRQLRRAATTIKKIKLLNSGKNVTKKNRLEIFKRKPEPIEAASSLSFHSYILQIKLKCGSTGPRPSSCHYDIRAGQSQQRDLSVDLFQNCRIYYLTLLDLR